MKKTIIMLLILFALTGCSAITTSATCSGDQSWIDGACQTRTESSTTSQTTTTAHTSSDATTWPTTRPITQEDTTRTTVTTWSGDYILANGSYDLSTLPAEEKSKILVEMERYLIDNVIGGVPLYTRGTFTIFSPRVEVYNDTYNGVMGYGKEFSTLTMDDSSVYLYDDVLGNEGQYTWRDTVPYSSDSFNPYNAQTYNDDTIIEKYTGGLYSFYYDDAMTGYDIQPTLASGDPIPLDPQWVDGHIVATTWQIPVRDDLLWTYHPSTDTSGFPEGHEVLDAQDYLWTWKLALDEGWFHAVSGGGDFISNQILNAEAYVNGTVTDFNQVGLRMAATKSNTLELEFSTEKDMFAVKYMLTGTRMSPINRALYEVVGEDNYGTSPQTVASSGPYVLTDYVEGDRLTYVKNANYPLADRYHFTHYQYRIISDPQTIFNEFLSGRLDCAEMPQAEVPAHADDPNVYSRPGDAVWRLVINGFGTPEARDAYMAEHPDVDMYAGWDPEPILMYTQMKQALYYGVNRENLTENIARAYLPATAYYPDSYFIDAPSGLSLHGNADAIAMLGDFAGDTYGYDPEKAIGLFKAAVAQAISEGYYTAGTPENPTIIELQTSYMSAGNQTIRDYMTALVHQYETLFYDDVNHVGVHFILSDYAWPTEYYHMLLSAQTDLGLGGLSTCFLCEVDFFNTFNDDNPSGFTMNWGIDTHTPNIEIAYTNTEGQVVHEIWSYNALTKALKDKTYVRDGDIQTSWSDPEGVIDVYLESLGMTSMHLIQDTLIIDQIYPTLWTDMEEGGYDAGVSYIVSTNAALDLLFVLGVKDNEYELFEVIPLYTTPEEAIQFDSGYSEYFVGASGPLTDVEVAANEYLTSLGYTSITDICTDVGANPTYAEIYAVDWEYSSSWSDAYVVIHIGDYYFGWQWL